MTELAPGLRGEASRTVTPDHTAEAVGSGTVPVFSTPSLLAMIEDAAVAALREALDPESTTVGVYAELEHLAASKVGARVRASAELVAVDGRVLEFACEAFDGETLIGRARHRRAIVNREKFLSRL
jgi:fluoroacetyl-CoA thioesterase